LNTFWEKGYLGADDSKYVGYVHSGFMNSYSQTRENVMAELADLLASNKFARVLFVGHSQGGAVAELAAIDFALTFTDWKTRMALITFGQPRVGDADFNSLCNSLIVDYVRFITLFKPKLLGLIVDPKEDIVTTVPPKTLGFAHTGTKIVLQCDASTRIGCHDINQYKLGVNVFFCCSKLINLYKELWLSC